MKLHGRQWRRRRLRCRRRQYIITPLKGGGIDLRPYLPPSKQLAEVLAVSFQHRWNVSKCAIRRPIVRPLVRPFVRPFVHVRLCASWRISHTNVMRLRTFSLTMYFKKSKQRLAWYQPCIHSLSCTEPTVREQENSRHRKRANEGKNQHYLH